eukprot:761154-Hanusia_phi.AAC.3
MSTEHTSPLLHSRIRNASVRTPNPLPTSTFPPFRSSSTKKIQSGAPGPPGLLSPSPGLRLRVLSSGRRTVRAYPACGPLPQSFNGLGPLLLSPNYLPLICSAANKVTCPRSVICHDNVSEKNLMTQTVETLSDNSRTQPWCGLGCGSRNSENF